MSSVIHLTDALAPNLNGYFWAIGDWIKNDEWLKKGGCKSPLRTI